MRRLNKKLQRFAEPGVKMYILIMCVFAALTIFYSRELAAAEAVVITGLMVFSVVRARKNRRELMQYIESVTYDAETAKNNTLLNFPLPMVVFKLNDDHIVWGNQVFFNLCGREKPVLGAKITSLIPDFTGKWLLEGKSQYPGLLAVGGRKYQVHGNIVRATEDSGSNDFMGITYWVDVTDYDDIRLEYHASRPVAALITLDNHDELVKNLTERQANDLRAAVDDKLIGWNEEARGYLKRFDQDRYLLVFEARALPAMIEDRFSILESVRTVVSPAGIHATLSIGVGYDGEGFAEDMSFASLGLEMALSRGGDQAVVKNRYNFEFYGGRGNEIETRTKVKARVTANALAELIADASQTFVMGHEFGDLDTVGAAAGVCCMARKLGRNAYIVIDPEKNAAKELIARLQEQPEYSQVFITPQDAILAADSRSLLVVVDTNRPEYVEDKNLLMACNRIAVIDHHRRAATYIQNATLTFHEPYASSAAELITELLQEVVDQSDILRAEAEALLAGMVLDTKSFTIRTGERTFEAAAFLRRAGADTTEVKKLLQRDLEHTVAKYAILQQARIYRDNIAVSVPEAPQDRIVAAQAADELLNITGVQASFVVYPAGDSSVSISARSIGDVNVQMILETMGGGGNRSVAAAQLPDTSLRDAVNMLFRSIDRFLDE